MDMINDCAGKKQNLNLNLKVIGVGLSRTGTYSLKKALDILGFPCYHFSELVKNKHADLWLDILSGKWEYLESVLNGYTATVDFPCVRVYRKLMEECPDAKIILTVRDKERWYESIKNTIYRISKETKLLSASEAALSELTMWEEGGLFDGRFEDREYAMGVYDAHVEAVKIDVPAHKLLVFNVKDGWDPLCDFLGVSLPSAETTFPHINKIEQVLKYIQESQQQM